MFLLHIIHSLWINLEYLLRHSYHNILHYFPKAQCTVEAHELLHYAWQLACIHNAFMKHYVEILERLLIGMQHMDIAVYS